MNSSVSLSVEHKMGCLWITLPDAISMYNSRELEKSISGNLDDGGIVVLDFSRTRNLFSSGLGLIIRIRKSVSENNGILNLVNVNEKLRDMFTALNLNKVLTIYATDVEFEISRNDLWQKHVADNSLGFLFVAQIENNIFRINISGEMVKGAKLDLCDKFLPSPNVSIYIMDLSNLELIDELGVAMLFSITGKIKHINGQCRIFGAEEWIQEEIQALGSAEFLSFFDDEKAAIENRCSPQ
jgi:anti-anti-sigma factor